MKIGYDAKRAFFNNTGLGNYSRSLLEAVRLHPNSTEVHLFAPKLPDSSVCEIPLNKYWLHTKKKYNPTWRQVTIADHIARSKVDLFHGLSNELPLKAVHCPTVVTIHDIIFKKLPKTYSAIDRLIYDRKTNWAVKKADKVIAVSTSGKNDLSKYYSVDPEKVVVIPPSIDTYFYKESTLNEQQSTREKYALPEKFNLYVGSIIPRKNLSLLIDAYAKARTKTPLVVVGRQSGYASYLKSVVAKAGMQDKIKWLHQVDGRAELKALYALCTKFLYVSKYEGFGMPLVEAQLQGAPCLTSTSSSLPEAGGPSATKIDPEDVDGCISFLETATPKLKYSPELRQHLNFFHPTNLANSMMELYQDLI